MTGNKGKFEEARIVLSKFDIEPHMVDLDVDEPQSDSIDYVSKVTALSSLDTLKTPLFVEDAGLFISALRGFPGVFSAYVHSTIGLDGILKLMEGFPDRSAAFRSAVGFTCPTISPKVLLFEGKVEGTIAGSPKGSGGFGFDPIFIPRDSSLTYAQMKAEDKCRTSHRARALESMGAYLSSHLELIK